MELLQQMAPDVEVWDESQYYLRKITPIVLANEIINYTNQSENIHELAYQVTNTFIEVTRNEQRSKLMNDGTNLIDFVNELLTHFRDHQGLTWREPTDPLQQQ